MVAVEVAHTLLGLLLHILLASTMARAMLIFRTVVVKAYNIARVIFSL